MQTIEKRGRHCPRFKSTGQAALGLSEICPDYGRVMLQGSIRRENSSTHCCREASFSRLGAGKDEAEHGPLVQT